MRSVWLQRPRQSLVTGIRFQLLPRLLEDRHAPLNRNRGHWISDVHASEPKIWMCGAVWHRLEPCHESNLSPIQCGDVSGEDCVLMYHLSTLILHRNRKCNINIRPATLIAISMAPVPAPPRALPSSDQPSRRHQPQKKH